MKTSMSACPLMRMLETLLASAHRRLRARTPGGATPWSARRMWRLLSAHERGDELEDVILDELRVDLRERAAAGRARGRARLRQGAVGVAHGAVVLASRVREMGARCIRRRGGCYAFGR